MQLTNSTVRLYQKLNDLHKNIMKSVDTRMCVHAYNDYLEYKQLVRRIVANQNSDAFIRYKELYLILSVLTVVKKTVGYFSL